MFLLGNICMFLFFHRKCQFTDCVTRQTTTKNNCCEHQVVLLLSLSVAWLNGSCPGDLFCAMWTDALSLLIRVSPLSGFLFRCWCYESRIQITFCMMHSHCISRHSGNSSYAFMKLLLVTNLLELWTIE